MTFRLLALKLGTSQLAAQRAGGAGRELFALATSPMVIVGLALYGVGAVLWLFVLGRTQLSLAYPFVGLGFIFTMLAGALVLHEPVGSARVAGTLLIVAGCVIVARSA